MFTGECQDSPKALKVTMELIMCRFPFIFKHNKWERFGSQELLTERLLGCSMGTELTPSLPEDSRPVPKPTNEHVFPKSSTQFVLTEP